jgi:hypothetical protein
MSEMLPTEKYTCRPLEFTQTVGGEWAAAYCGCKPVSNPPLFTVVLCPKHAATDALLEAASLAATALSIADRKCYDRPLSGDRCGECLGCGLDAAHTLTRAAIARAGGQP